MNDQVNKCFETIEFQIWYLGLPLRKSRDTSFGKGFYEDYHSQYCIMQQIWESVLSMKEEVARKHYTVTADQLFSLLEDLPH
jgi:hypothetical protein